MNIKNLLIDIVILIVVAMFIVGCATKEVVTVKETKTVYKPVPEHLMVPCKLKTPIPVNDYLKLNQVGREEWLADYSLDLMETIGICNNNLKLIREFNKKQMDLYNGK